MNFDIFSLSSAIALALFLANSGVLPAQTVKPAKDADVWAISGWHKVHPISGNLLSEGVNIYSGKRPSEGGYRRANSVWDASSATISLFGGRNEFVSFQLVIEKGKEDLHKVFVNCSDLISESDRISADSSIHLFRQLHVKLDGVWYPDAILPFTLAGTTPFHLPDYDTFPEQRVQTIWVDVFIPHGVLPGLYAGELIVLHRNTNRQSVLKVKLEVGDFTLPDETNLAVDLMNYGFVSIERGWPDMILDGPRHRAIEREFYRLAHKHRMTFNILPYNHDGMIPKGLKPELAGVGSRVEVRDWTSWDERFGPMLSGEAFQDLPRKGQPVSHFFLPYNLRWPSAMSNWNTPDYRIEHLRISQEFREHLRERGWTKPQYQIYYNHKEHYNFFPWNLDEPTREKDLQALHYLGEILDEGFPSSDPVEVCFRLDIGHFFCENNPECSRPRETSHQVIERLGSLVDLWNIGSPHYWTNLEQVRQLKQEGKTMYFYNGTPRVSEPLLNSVFWGWRGFQYEADGICFWNATDWVDWDTDGPVLDPFTNAGGRYQGFSMIFYPGYKFGYDGPIPSIRLKAMLRGMQDFEYATMLENRGLLSRGELIQLSDRLTSSDEPDYAKLRRTIFDRLNGAAN